MNRLRIQPKVAIELEAVSLRLRAQVGRHVECCAKYLGGTTDRTYLASQAIEIALRQDAEIQKTLCARGSRPRPVRATPLLYRHTFRTPTLPAGRLALPASSHRAPAFMPAPPPSGRALALS